MPGDQEFAAALVAVWSKGDETITSRNLLVLHVLDTHQTGVPGIIAATALETSEGIALFDTGPESTFGNIVSELQKIGAAPADVRHVFLSHIHLDHAGAAWRFAELGAHVYVHPRGANHLLDPSKLVASATRIFGADMPRLWGRIAPVPPASLRILEDNATVNVAPFEIRAIATPGHASHHHIYQWNDHVFGGDVAGVRIGAGPPSPPFVPPELHIEEWLESIDKIRTLEAEHLYLPHFGRALGSVPAHLDSLERNVRKWAEWFRDRIAARAAEAHLVPEFARYQENELRGGGATAEEAYAYELADPSAMAVTAAFRYWQKFHPEEVGFDPAKKENKSDETLRSN